jgi:hypothetical protein
MNHMSTAAANFPSDSVVTPAWKNIAGHIGAILVAIIFLGAGIGKIVVPYMVQTLFEQLLVPAWGSLPLVLALGIAETTFGFLVIFPKYRRIGAIGITLLLLIFMGYVGIRYNELVGRDCSCFPWLKRTVNPAFFVEDGAMLLGSLVAWAFSRKIPSLKIPLYSLLAVAILSGVSFAYVTSQQSNVNLPAQITVDGKPFALKQGRTFLFFYDPACSHCEAAAKDMSTYKWKSDVTLIGLPTNDPQWAASFLHDTKFNAKTSLDTKQLRELFVFPNPPYGVALDNGRVKGNLSHFEKPDPQPELKALGFVE